jgi:hypothetical protein
MLHMDADTEQFVAKLRRELEWLKAEHPNQFATVFVVESYLRTLDMAGSTASAPTPVREGEVLPPPAFTLTSVDWAAILVKDCVPTSE